MWPRATNGRCAWPVILAIALAGQARAGLVFNLIDTGGVGPGSQAEAGFTAAASYWSSRFSDDVTVNLEVGFRSLGADKANILGETSWAGSTVTFDSWKSALAADQSSSDDSVFVSHLPGGSAFSLYINGTADNPNGSGSLTPYVDNDGGANNSQVRLSYANQKAIGLRSANDAAVDATITFNSDFSFDFSQADGIDSSKYDFIGVATHEIGHAMGFISGVDVLDNNIPPVNPAGPFNDDLFTFVSGLDFLRFSADSESAGADIDWTADTRPKYYSIDGGATVGAPGSNHWSTGLYFGDGRQASHWKDSLSLGMMDPTAAPGELVLGTALDLQAMDLIGWDQATAVPEPSTAALAGLCALLMCAPPWFRKWRC